MEAHRSYERFEQGHLVAGGDGDAGAHHGRTAAMVVAVMAAFLALATFLANEAVKEVITGETHRAETSGQLESNRLKIDVVSGNSELLRAIGTGTLRLGPAATAARWHEARVARELKPADARLVERIQAHERETDHANSSTSTTPWPRSASRLGSCSPRSRSSPAAAGCSAPAAWRPAPAWRCC